MIEESGVENYLVGLSPQVRHLLHRAKEGDGLVKERYVVLGDKGDGGRKAIRTQCRYCEEIFHCRPDLINHQTRVHPSLPVRAGKKARRPCPQCHKMVINLSLHIRNKHESDPVNTSDGLAQCRLCGDTYPANTDHQSHWRLMNKHRKIVHMGMKMTCPHCSKTYHDSQSLKKHIDAVHLKIKRLCPLCGASVTALAVHMNSVHTGSKNFGCNECGKKFKSNYDLNRHRDTVHLGNKPVCPFCGKHLANIRQHIRVVHKQIRFPCSVCKKQMTTKAELRKHFAKAHFNPVSDQVAEPRPEHIDQLSNQQQHEHQPQHQQLETKELAEEHILAQYFGRQFQVQTSKPDDVSDLLPKGENSDESHHLVIKPDLDQLMAARQHHHLHNMSVKPEMEQQQQHVMPTRGPAPPLPHHSLAKQDIDQLLLRHTAGAGNIDQLLGRGGGYNNSSTQQQ